MITPKQDEQLMPDPRTHIYNETARPDLEANLATRYALANGYLGIRGTHEEMPEWASAGFFVAGTYCAAPAALVPIHSPAHILTHPTRILPERHADYISLTTMPNLPNPVAVRLTLGGELISLDNVAILACERVLHMEDARLTRRMVIRNSAGQRATIDSERVVSWANPQLIIFRYQVQVDDANVDVTVEPYIAAQVSNMRGIRLFTVAEEHCAPHLNLLLAHIAEPEQQVAIVQAYNVYREGRTVTLEVIVAVDQKSLDDAQQMAQDGLATGYMALYEEHLVAVQQVQQRVKVDLEADVLSVQGFKFNQLHLEMALCPDNPAVSVPIKGLTGEGYRFMVFWDTDFHLFPYYLLTNPTQARNLIIYRYNQLPAYRRFAQFWGYAGAQVPWETGSSGEEETAPWLCLQEREIHISADVAYAVKLYDEWTTDASVLIHYGAEIVFETARFYASRVIWNAEGNRYEIRDIGCPDQYHTFADNNVFISRMARFNLEYAASLGADPRLAGVREKLLVGDDEVANFQHIAKYLYIIQPDDEGIIEEFDGFFALSSDLRGISEHNCSHTQAVKQPDVLALYLPFHADYSPEVLQRNWYYYQARTSHGSSLSLPGMGLAAALAGLPDEAADYFLRSSRMDLDDVNGNTNLGVHLAGYAVLWETLSFGFSGLRLYRDRIEFAPHFPRRWGKISYRFTWHGSLLHVTVTADSLQITSMATNLCEVPVQVIGSELYSLAIGEEYTVAY